MAGDKKNPFPWTALLGSLGGLGSALLGYFSNRANVKQQERANEQNIAMTREGNAIQVRENEKAYQRSLPSTQVANFRAAGMSHAGALQALSGGGSYTPAPVNTAQVDPVQGSSAGAQQGIDTMVNALMQQQSNNTQYRIAKEQLETQRAIARENNKTSVNVAKIQQESARYTADTGLTGTKYSSDKDYEGRDLTSRRQMFTALQEIGLGYAKLEEVQRQYDDMSEYNKKKFNAEILHLQSQTNLDNERKKEIAAKLAEWNSNTQKNARSAISLMQTYLGYQSYYETELKLQKFLKYTGAEVYWHGDDNGVGGLVPNIRFSRDFINDRTFWETEMGEFWNDLNRSMNSELISDILSVVILKR